MSHEILSFSIVKFMLLRNIEDEDNLKNILKKII